MKVAPWWRHIVLGCLCAGLASSPAVTLPSGWQLVLTASLTVLLVLLRTWPAPAGMVLLCALALTAGVGIGGLRLAALDGRALTQERDERVRAEGFVADQPREIAGETRFTLATADGRIGLALDRPPGASVGDRLAVAGVLRPVEPWLAAMARRQGWRLEIHARSAHPLPGSRAGLAGTLDTARDHAATALGEGLDNEQAALLRGFVLGQDEQIDPLVRDDFTRAGLAHLLAVSGQNVMLLAILVGILCAALGLPPGLRMAVIVALIAVYVPIAGGGPSIQRAGVMGAAAIGAGMLGRRSDRAWIVLAGAAFTLALQPLSATDIGWQLSFAAVIGIALWAGRIAALLEARLAPGPGRSRTLRGRIARPLAEAAGLTIAATVATAPLIAHTFGTFSIASLPANLAVAPAVAPVMWLGMTGAALGQIPGLPTALLGHVSGPLLDYIGAVAHAFAAPRWSSLPVAAPGTAATLAIYAAVVLGMPPLLGALERRREGRVARSRRSVLALAGAGALVLLLIVPAVTGAGDTSRAAPPGRGTLRITAVDVGQGDAILLQPAGGDALLIDAGPPDDGLVDSLRTLGVDRLAAVLITHPHLDHYGGFGDLIDAIPVDRLVLDRPVPEAAGAARAASIPIRRLGAGSELRDGRLRLEILYPAIDAVPADPDPNASSIVAEARYGPWSALLPGDGEQDMTGLQLGPFDVLKVAHHGSSDTGLDQLLARSAPRVALISVGAGNDYGHPDADTLATLARHGVCVLRTDVDGDVGVEIGKDGLSAFAEHGIDASRPGCDGL